MVAFTDKSDDAGRLTELVYTNATPEEIREFEWIYDAAGRIVAHDSDIDSEDVNDYGYDATDQLTSADYDTGSDESYTYDANGRNKGDILLYLLMERAKVDKIIAWHGHTEFGDSYLISFCCGKVFVIIFGG